MTTRLCDTCHAPEADEGQGLWEFFKGAKLVALRCRLCEIRRRHKVWCETGRLDGKLLLEAIWIAPRSSGRKDAFGKDDVVDLTKTPFSTADAIALLDVTNHLKEMAKRFEQAIWFNGLQTYSRTAEVHGHSYEDGDIKVLLLSMAGRAMITMSDPVETHDFTVITDESSSSSCMGWQSVNATELQAGLLIDTLISKWPVQFKPDAKVGM